LNKGYETPLYLIATAKKVERLKAERDALLLVCKRKMNSDDACNMPFNEDMAEAIAKVQE
jgi:hypothetical protein